MMKCLPKIIMVLLVGVFGSPLDAADPVIGPPIRVSVEGGMTAAVEVSVAVSRADPNHVLVSWNDYRVPQPGIAIGAALSTDRGLHWQADFITRPPDAFQNAIEGDPMTAVDHATGDIWLGGITFDTNPTGGVFLARKPTGDTEFEPSTMAINYANPDKGWMASGAVPGMPGVTRLYVVFNGGLVRSDDLGQSWGSLTPFPSGLGYLPRTGPNGELYVTYWDWGTRMMLMRSFDGGDTFDPPIVIATRIDVWGIYDGSRFPGRFRVPVLSYLAVDDLTGQLYCVYFDTSGVVGGQYDVDLYFTKSVDRGTTWSVPSVIVDDDERTGDQFFPWIEVDEWGGLHMVYYDTRNTEQLDDSVHGWVDAYYARSTDSGQSWVSYRLTSSPFNSFDDGLSWDPDQFLGDYLGLAVADAFVFAAYGDTRNGDLDVYAQTITLPEADCDRDGDVDLTDFASFHGCRQGPGAGILPGCGCFDFDGSGAIDFRDFASLQREFNP